MAHFAVPIGTHLHPGKNRQVLFGGKFLDTGNCINTIMIGHRDKVKAFIGKIIYELLSWPAAIAEVGVHM